MHSTKKFPYRPASLLLLAVAFLPLFASCSSGRKAGGNSRAGSSDSAEIHWMSMAEAEAAMKRQPRKVWIDVYTDWCGWCKVMDKKTFTSPDVIRYMNRHYYAVKLNAETRDSIRFHGTTYGTSADGRNHALAVFLLRGEMGYPSSVIVDETFEHSYAFMGYQTVPQAEAILKYFNEGWHTKLTWEQYTSQHPSTWRDRTAAEEPVQH